MSLQIHRQQSYSIICKRWGAERARGTTSYYTHTYLHTYIHAHTHAYNIYIYIYIYNMSLSVMIGHCILTYYAWCSLNVMYTVIYQTLLSCTCAYALNAINVRSWCDVWCIDGKFQAYTCTLTSHPNPFWHTIMVVYGILRIYIYIYIYIWPSVAIGHCIIIHITHDFDWTECDVYCNMLNIAFMHMCMCAECHWCAVVVWRLIYREWVPSLHVHTHVPFQPLIYIYICIYIYNQV